MKKILSVFLATIMIFSCFSVLPASAEEGGLGDVLYSEETVLAAESALKNFVVKNLPERFDGDLEDFKALPEWEKISLMGITPEFLYSSKGSLVWGQLDVFLTDANGKIIYDKNGNTTLKINKSDISLAMINLNIYLQRVFYNLYGGLNLYTVENAVKLANSIGKMFNHAFEELSVANLTGLFGNETPSANEFFEAVSKLSGFDKIVEINWVSKGRSFCEPLVTVLGGEYVNFYSDYYNDGLKLSSKLLEAIVGKFLTVGPIQFILDVLEVFASPAYEYTYREPTLALFTKKIGAFSNSGIPEDELRSFNGLLKLIFCDCDPINKTGCFSVNVEDVDHFCPFEFPIARYNSAADVEENYIYLYYYLNICGVYRGNTAYFKNIQKSIDKNIKLSRADKDKLIAIIDGFFLGNFSNTVDSVIIPLYKENVETVTDSIFDRFRNAVMVLLKRIADYFEYLRKIFSGELDYGQGNSPFN